MCLKGIFLRKETMMMIPISYTLDKGRKTIVEIWFKNLSFLPWSNSYFYCQGLSGTIWHLSPILPRSSVSYKTKNFLLSPILQDGQPAYPQYSQLKINTKYYHTTNITQHYVIFTLYIYGQIIVAAFLYKECYFKGSENNYSLNFLLGKPSLKKV